MEDDDDYGNSQDAIDFAKEAQSQLTEILDRLEELVAAPEEKYAADVRVALQHAADIIDLDRGALDEVLALLPRPVDLGGGRIYVARIVEAAFTIGVFTGQHPKARGLARWLEAMTETSRAKRPLGVRARIIASLRRLYPEADPVTTQGLSIEDVRRAVEKELCATVSPRTLDRARKEAYE